MPGLSSIDGLASNLNTTEIIDAIMAYERRPVLLMQEEQALKTNEITTFNALSAKLLALQASITALTNEKSFSQASLNVSDSTLLDATAEGAVSSGSYTLDILSLAQNHQIASQGFANSSTSVLGTGTITLALGDQSSTTITVDSSNNSLVGIKNAINDANIDITASIVNDGSSSKPYRLVLTGDETGQKNKITFSSTLSGGTALDYTTSTFDDPELISFSTAATSQISLGASASYTGTTNKTFTFTVAGTGTQTVGSGNITIDWTDGTDSGSITVSQADTEVVGPEGLKISFADGDLVAGDTFKVTTFAPLLQQASDSKISIGSSANGASPIVINSETNTVKDVIPGVTLNLKNVTTATTGPVTITAGLNVSEVTSKVTTFIDAYNDVMRFIDNQNTFSETDQEKGVLLGDLTLMTIQSRLKNVTTNVIKGLDQSMNTLSAIGVRTNTKGLLYLQQSSKLSEALKNDFKDVLKLFADGGSSVTEGISFISASSRIVGGTSLDVDITQAATSGYFQGQNMTDPAMSNITLDSTNNILKFKVDGMISDDIVLSSRTYTSGADLAKEIQTKLNADKKVGNRGASVEWVDVGGNEGYLKISSTTYGSSSKIELMTSSANTAFATLGLAAGTGHTGYDVAGTINGEKATGQGQVLTGNEGNSTTDGLKLKITLAESAIIDGSEGSITVTRGVASILRDTVNDMTKSGEGVIARKTGSLEKQIASIKQNVLDFDKRLAYRRQTLTLKWIALESTLSQFQSESSFLESQLAGITSNLSKILEK
jgi:flagellar hook-associated protein 2